MTPRTPHSRHFPQSTTLEFLRAVASRHASPRRSVMHRSPIPHSIKNIKLKAIRTGVTRSDSSARTMSSTPQPSPTFTALPRSSYPSPIYHSPQDLQPISQSPDAEFYAEPRFVHHIDEAAVAALNSYYGSVIQPGSTVLDLCSSWTSHVPTPLGGSSAGNDGIGDDVNADNDKPTVIGVGMNATELQANPLLSRRIVRDLNAWSGPRMLEEIEDQSVDTVICSVSVDYLTKPVDVFQELGRVLKAGGSAHMAISERCFPNKVVGAWLSMMPVERRRWVGGYFWAAGGFQGVQEGCLTRGGLGEDSLWIVKGRKEIAEGDR